MKELISQLSKSKKLAGMYTALSLIMLILFATTDDIVLVLIAVANLILAAKWIAEIESKQVS